MHTTNVSYSYKSSKKFEDPIIIISRISDRQHKKEKSKTETKEQTMLYKILHRKLKIEQHEATSDELSCPGRVNSSCSIMAPVVLVVVLEINLYNVCSHKYY